MSEIAPSSSRTHHLSHRAEDLKLVGITVIALVALAGTAAGSGHLLGKWQLPQVSKMGVIIGTSASGGIATLSVGYILIKVLRGEGAAPPVTSKKPVVLETKPSAQLLAFTMQQVRQSNLEKVALQQGEWVASQEGKKVILYSYEKGGNKATTQTFNDRNALSNHLSRLIGGGELNEQMQSIPRAFFDDVKLSDAIKRAAGNPPTSKWQAILNQKLLTNQCVIALVEEGRQKVYAVKYRDQGAAHLFKTENDKALMHKLEELAVQGMISEAVEAPKSCSVTSTIPTMDYARYESCVENSYLAEGEWFVANVNIDGKERYLLQCSLGGEGDGKGILRKGWPFVYTSSEQLLESLARLQLEGRLDSTAKVVSSQRAAGDGVALDVPYGELQQLHRTEVSGSQYAIVKCRQSGADYALGWYIASKETPNGEPVGSRKEWITTVGKLKEEDKIVGDLLFSDHEPISGKQWRATPRLHQVEGKDVYYLKTEHGIEEFTEQRFLAWKIDQARAENTLSGNPQTLPQRDLCLMAVTAQNHSKVPLDKGEWFASLEKNEKWLLSYCRRGGGQVEAKTFSTQETLSKEISELIGKGELKPTMKCPPEDMLPKIDLEGLKIEKIQPSSWKALADGEIGEGKWAIVKVTHQKKEKFALKYFHKGVKIPLFETLEAATLEVRRLVAEGMITQQGLLDTLEDKPQEYLIGELNDSSDAGKALSELWGGNWFVAQHDEVYVVSYYPLGETTMERNEMMLIFCQTREELLEEVARVRIEHVLDLLPTPINDLIERYKTYNVSDAPVGTKDQLKRTKVRDKQYLLMQVMESVERRGWQIETAGGTELVTTMDLIPKVTELIKDQSIKGEPIGEKEKVEGKAWRLTSAWVVTRQPHYFLKFCHGTEKVYNDTSLMSINWEIDRLVNEGIVIDDMRITTLALPQKDV